MFTSETITRSVQPDIQNHPDYEKYQARTLRRKQNEVLQATLPDGFPPQFDSPLVWEGNGMIWYEGELTGVDLAIRISHIRCAVVEAWTGSSFDQKSCCRSGEYFFETVWIGLADSFGRIRLIGRSGEFDFIPGIQYRE